MNELKLKKIPSITDLATTTALNTICNVSNLVKKNDYDTKISETKNKITTDHDPDKYSTTQEFNIRKFYCKTKTSKFSKRK